MQIKRFGFGFVSRVVLISLLCIGVAGAMSSNKWRLQVSGGADSDGVITLRFHSTDEHVYEVAVEVEDGTGENKVARTIRDKLREELPKDIFHIEVDDGEDVLIKKRHFEHNFGLEIVDNTVDGVRLNPDRE